jgi:hypothetical protein
MFWDPTIYRNMNKEHSAKFISIGVSGLINIEIWKVDIGQRSLSWKIFFSLNFSKNRNSISSWKGKY